MVFFNYATMQMAAKVVYYGPGLCGKTTNLHHIYGKTAPGSRGEMISLETETDRTLFFDLLPIDVGVIGGFKTRLQLYTVPGQVFYNTTRKLVLRGVDGIVFVADSQRAMKEANVESFQNMEVNLKEIGLTAEEIPLVIQFNKRDLANALPVPELIDSLDPAGRYSYVEAAALRGDGVFETLKQISKLTLKSLKKKMLGEERSPSRPAVPTATAAFEAPRPARPVVAAPPPPEAEEPRISLSDLRADAEAAASALAEQIDSDGLFEHAEAIDELPPSVEAFRAPEPAPAIGSAEPELEFIAEESEQSAPEPRAPVLPAGRSAAEETVQIEFDQTEAAPAVDIVKHVKVRSNVDILSELEKLRKNATLKPMPEGPVRAGRRMTSENISIDDLLSSRMNHKKEVQRLVEFEVKKKELSRVSRAVLSLRLDDPKNKPVAEEKSVEIDLSDMKDVEKLLLSLKFHVTGK
jgi:signal recognition particle receptor subunit beta